MRCISILPVFLAAALSTAGILAADPGIAPDVDTPVAEYNDATAEGAPCHAGPQPCCEPPCEPRGEPCCGDSGGNCRGDCCELRPLGGLFRPRSCGSPGCGGCGGHEPVSCFNCCCRGSYKFPVPPLYTYFWPGIYSQQTITGCMSPYRFAPLAPPEDVFGQNGAPNKQLQARLVPPSADRAKTAGASEGAR